MYENFSPESKVWVYQSSRPFTSEEKDKLNLRLSEFAREWTAHQQQLKATGFVFMDRIIVLMVDETQAGTSGCSIDKSVHFLKEIEKEYHTELFNRMLVGYFDNDEIKTTTLSEIAAFDEETRVINPLVTTKQEFDRGFITTIGKCWMREYAL